MSREIKLSLAKSTYKNQSSWNRQNFLLLYELIYLYQEWSKFRFLCLDLEVDFKQKMQFVYSFRRVRKINLQKQIVLTLSKFHFTIQMNISLYEGVHNFNSFSFSILKLILNKICNLYIRFARSVFREINCLSDSISSEVKFKLL